MDQKTSSYYKQKVAEVLNYVDSHLADDLNIRSLSEKYSISFYHFHRIIKAAIDEPLGSYINRKRLDTAVKLIRYSNEPIADIAFKTGYDDISAFSKAFSKEFGLSPQEFKNNTGTVLNTHIDYRINDSGKIVSDIKPKIITVPSKNVIYTSVTGEYGGEKFNMVWDDLFAFAIQNRLLGWKPDIFSIYYDEPYEIGIEKCRADLCIATYKVIEPTGQIDKKTISGGKYAVFRYRGPYNRLWDLYETIYSVWVLNSGEKLRDFPIVEKYLNYSPKTNPRDYLTEIYVPIE
jgi:AraC family transcriptional regulator